MIYRPATLVGRFFKYHSMNYLQIEFETPKDGETDILLALLADAGFESFEETEDSLRAFIKEAGFEEGILENILTIVPVNYCNNRNIATKLERPMGAKL